MIYTKALPCIDNIIWLASLSRPFPITAGEILEIADANHFDEGTHEFLKLFPQKEIFQDENDFLTRSDELETLLSQERLSSREFLRSPQE